MRPLPGMAPTYAQLAGEMEPASVSPRSTPKAEQQLAARFNIRSIPTLAIFKGGREIARQSGAVDPATLKRWVQTHL